MATKQVNKSFEERLKESNKEWADIFADVFANVSEDAPLDLLLLFGAPLEVLLKNNTAKKIIAEVITKKVRAEVTAKLDAEDARKMQAVVLHLYHTIGLSYTQIAGTVDISEEQVKKIINNNDKAQ